MLRRDSNQVLIAILLDILCVFLAVGIAIWLRLNLPLGRPLLSDTVLKALFIEAGLLYPLVFLLFSIYDPERVYRATDEYQILSRASFIAGLALAGLVYFTTREISRLFLVYFYSIHFILVTFWRVLARMLRQGRHPNGEHLRKVLLIGGGEAARQTLMKLHNLAWAGVQLVGYLTDGDPIPQLNGGIPQLGVLKDVEDVVRSRRVDDVLVALPAESYGRVQRLVAQLLGKPCNVWVVPDYFSLLIYGSRVEDLGGVPMISIKAPSITGYQRVVKRAFDLIFSTLLLLVSLPFMAVIALLIKLDSSGPVLYRQERVGENGRVFWMYKFRSMVREAEHQLNHVLRRDESGKLIHKFTNDPRVTRIGRYIRRTSLDELPQLINVIKGEMSLVGPRPELPFFVEQYEPWQLQRLAVPQGITGWWQVNGRSDKPMHLHTKDDLYYVQNYSLLLDLQILLKTVPVVLRGKGAY